MKKLFVMLACVGFVGCTQDIPQGQLDAATKLCEPHGGVYSLSVDSIANLGHNLRYANCKDGSAFDNKMLRK